MKIPQEDFDEGDEDRVAKLRLSLYGTRDAAQNWVAECTRRLLKLGFHWANDEARKKHGLD
ncbi:MAG: hypothetical protein CBC59_005085 [Euryarchaeota archaeon TMED99]|nr:MAG: hypothetical protein CBC59_005085 [Euryarchaeota archaeon TMED99]